MRMTIVMVIIGYVLTLLVEWGVYKTLRSRTSRRVWTVQAILCFLWLSLIVIWPKRDADASLISLMWMIYSYITVIGTKFVYLLFAWPSIIWRRSGFVRFLRAAGVPVAIVFFITLWWGALCNRYDIEVVDVPVVSDRLPSSFDGYKVVQISDAHVGTWGNDTLFIHSLVDSVNAQNADLILFTGDIVNRNSGELSPFVEVFSRLKAKDGIYTIMGNHDYGDYQGWPSEQAHRQDAENLRKMQKKMGWKMLDNSMVYIKSGNDSIRLSGVENWGEPPFSTYGNLSEALPTNADKNVFTVLMSHNPEHWVREVREYTVPVDLTLAGHTHAMQITLRTPGGGRWSPSAWKYDNWGGMYDAENGRRLYVNIGCGEVGFPARIGARPEITVFTLEKAKAD